MRITSRRIFSLAPKFSRWNIHNNKGGLIGSHSRSGRLERSLKALDRVGLCLAQLQVPLVSGIPGKWLLLGLLWLAMVAAGLAVVGNDCCWACCGWQWLLLGLLWFLIVVVIRFSDELAWL